MVLATCRLTNCWLSLKRKRTQIALNYLLAIENFHLDIEHFNLQKIGHARSGYRGLDPLCCIHNLPITIKKIQPFVEVRGCAFLLITNKLFMLNKSFLITGAVAFRSFGIAVFCMHLLYRWLDTSIYYLKARVHLCRVHFDLSSLQHGKPVWWGIYRPGW
jgi:uncharacterized membrane protein YciS (DUF1049 family)